MVHVRVATGPLRVSDAPLCHAPVMRRVQASSKFGYGGAVYVGKGLARLNDCVLFGNIARMTGQALHASGGAVAIAEGATLELQGTQMHSNTAGGKGFYELLGVYAGTSKSYLEARAAYMDCAGTLLVAQSTLSAPPPSISTALDRSATALIISRSGRGAVTLQDSTFESADAGTVILRLVGPTSQSLVRGCKFRTNLNMTNMTIDVADGSAVRFAAVNSSFEPPVVFPETAAVLRPPMCSQQVAGEAVCDARAICESRSSGGIQCTCTGDGMRNRDGTVPDGRQCESLNGLDLQVQSTLIVIKVEKPGNYTGMGERLLMSLQARGEKKFKASFSLQLVHSAARRCGESCVWSSGWNATSMATHQPHGLNGYFLNWTVPQSSDSLIELDPDAARSIFHLQVRLDAAGCGNASECIADGDSVKAVIQIAAPADASHVQSSVTLITEVEALVSCERSRIRTSILGDGTKIFVQSSFTVHVFAIDVDGINVDWTRATVLITFNDRSTAVLWSPGSNKYVSEITDQLTDKPGRYNLLVTVQNAWSEASGNASSCVLLNKTVLVQCSNGADTSDCATPLQFIIVGGIVGALIVVLIPLAAYQMRAHQEQVKRFLLSFLMHECVLVAKICWEAWVRSRPLALPTVIASTTGG
jgi:hypothetical protein